MENLPEKCSATHILSSFSTAVSFIHVPNVVSILVTFLRLMRDLIRQPADRKKKQIFKKKPTFFLCVQHSVDEDTAAQWYRSSSWA